MTSILTSIKKMLGISEDDNAFDVDIIININSALSDLNLLGVGPSEGFIISDSTETWESFIGLSKNKLEMVKSYVYLRVRLLFDPPQNSFLVASMEKQIEEFGWKINVIVEEGLDYE